MLRCLDPARRFLLKGVKHPEIAPDLHGVDDAERISPVAQRNFSDARPQSLHRLDDVGALAFRGDGERAQALLPSIRRKRLERLSGCLDPRDRARSPRHAAIVVVFDNIGKNARL
ncbi:hypothetical protein [Methylorubrum podarium]|uniref:hypothetical protein n=1 Tax=Methylorubrum podarium TaxID=200476 RepID=UPI001EE21C79|nr:hypothetical protein [Methylorubrum podarium]